MKTPGFPVTTTTRSSVPVGTEEVMSQGIIVATLPPKLKGETLTLGKVFGGYENLLGEVAEEEGGFNKLFSRF